MYMHLMFSAQNHGWFVCNKMTRGVYILIPSFLMSIKEVNGLILMVIDLHLHNMHTERIQLWYYIALSDVFTSYFKI